MWLILVIVIYFNLIHAAVCTSVYVSWEVCCILTSYFYQTMYVNITSSHCLQEEWNRLRKVCATATVVCMSVEVRMHSYWHVPCPKYTLACDLVNDTIVFSSKHSLTSLDKSWAIVGGCGINWPHKIIYSLQERDELERTLTNTLTEDDRKRKQQDLEIVKAKRNIADSKAVRQTNIMCTTTVLLTQHCPTFGWLCTIHVATMLCLVKTMLYWASLDTSHQR